MTIKILTRENIPCWYEMSWQSPALVLRIHKEFINNRKVNLKNAPITQHFKKEHNLPDFKDDFNEDIGFGGIFKYKGESDNFIEFQIGIPQIKKFTGNKCKDCDGTGYDEDIDRECLRCEGGNEWTMNWKEITSISATFSVLTAWLQYPEIDTSCHHLQLLTFQTITLNDIHGGSLNGECSFIFKSCLELLGDIKLSEVTEVTKFVYSKMFGWKEYYQYDFNAWISKGMFVINCPGNACGLHPSDWYSFKNEGFKFSCHNVDSSAQQLTLLAGLAVLWDIVKEKGFKIGD